MTKKLVLAPKVECAGLTDNILLGSFKSKQLFLKACFNFQEIAIGLDQLLN